MKIIKKRAKKVKPNQGVTNQDFKKAVEAALERRQEPRWVKGRLVPREQ